MRDFIIHLWPGRTRGTLDQLLWRGAKLGNVHGEGRRPVRSQGIRRDRPRRRRLFGHWSWRRRPVRGIGLQQIDGRHLQNISAA
ncbi:hypothetical protein CBM2599_A120528 [Cupriavidus taiwanensis]|nr:hypothetical protein CBM2599_A120528 [Cupriavidus taiwanensis]SOY81932.1 hypothetical protein CBM2600_A120550 [Cupriavidus taiwanensis]